jgi:hypothetical protein
MRDAGFARVSAFLTLRRRTVTAPIEAVVALEASLRASGALGRRLARTRPGTGLLGCRIAAVKARSGRARSTRPADPRAARFRRPG